MEDKPESLWACHFCNAQSNEDFGNYGFSEIQQLFAYACLDCISQYDLVLLPPDVQKILREQND